jgi:hypothetical protein
MSDQPVISPDVALRRFLEVIANEAAANTGFRNRLLQAVGVKVVFEGEDDIATADPVDLAQRYSEDAFKRIYGILKAPDLQSLMIGRGLATKDTFPVKPKKRVPELLALLWETARERADELADGAGDF